MVPRPAPRRRSARFRPAADGLERRELLNATRFLPAAVAPPRFGFGLGFGFFFSQVATVSVDRGHWSSAQTGTTAQLGIVYNRGDLNPRTITITVSGPGVYLLDQTASWGVINNTGVRWKSYKLTVLNAQSTARPTVASTADLSGQLPKVTLSFDAKNNPVFTFSGGKGVPTGPSTATAFQPLTVITTLQAGTIVLVQQPIR